MKKDEKVRVLVAEGCPVCTDLKKKIVGDKRFEVLDVTSNPDALRLAHELGVKAVPTFLYPNKTGGICVLNDDGKVGKCIKETKKHAKK